MQGNDRTRSHVQEGYYKVEQISKMPTLQGQWSRLEVSGNVKISFPLSTLQTILIAGSCWDRIQVDSTVLRDPLGFPLIPNEIYCVCVPFFSIYSASFLLKNTPLSFRQLKSLSQFPVMTQILFILIELFQSEIQLSKGIKCLVPEAKLYT